MSELKIGKLITREIEIKAPKEFAHLLPSRKKESVELRFDGCRSSVVNALRRVIMSEMNIIGLNASNSSFDTNDAYIFEMLEMIIQRVKSIPVDQKTPVGTQFRIDVDNSDKNTNAIVTMGQAKQISGAKMADLPFEKNIVLLEVQPRRKFKCTMHVDELYASERTNGCRAVASGVCSVLANPEDAYNQYTGTGTPVMQSDHRSWLLRFDTNGIMSAKDIITTACNRILRRLHDAHSAAQEKFELINEEHRLTISETPTIGELIREKVYFNQNDVEAVFMNTDDRAGTITIRLKTSVDPAGIVAGAVDLLIEDFNRIKSAIA